MRRMTILILMIGQFNIYYIISYHLCIILEHITDTECLIFQVIFKNNIPYDANIL